MNINDNHSFTMQFNPINNNRPLKEIEKELDELRSENFTLKHQISLLRENPTSNEELEKLLISNKTLITTLESDKQKLIEEIKTLREKNFENNEYLKNCQEENQRLLNYIETLNTKNEESSIENNKLKKYYEEKLNEYQKTFEINQTDFENKNFLKDEVYKLRNENKNYLEKFKEMSILQNDLEKLQSQIYNLEVELNLRDEKINNLQFEYKKLLGINEKLSKEIESNRKNKHNELSKDYAVLLDKEKEKFERKLKEILYKADEKLKTMKEELDQIKKSMNDLINLNTNEKSLLNNVKFIKKVKNLGIELPLTVCSITDILKKFYLHTNKIEKKLEITERELNDIKYFKSKDNNSDKNELMKLLEEFSREFEGARNELNECQEYLEKKGLQNKELKKELNKLKLSLQKVSYKYEITQKNKFDLQEQLKNKEIEIKKLYNKLG